MAASVVDPTVVTEVDEQKVPYDKFNSKRIKISEPLDKEVEDKKTKQKIKYKHIPISYMYPVPGTKQSMMDSFYLEGPEMITKHGLSSRNEGDYEKYYIMFKMIRSDKEIDKFVSVIDQIYKKAVNFCYKIRFNLKKKDLSIDNPEASFKYPIYKPVDENTGEYKDQDPSWIVNLVNSSIRKTRFINPATGKDVDWDKLRDAEVKMIPCFYVYYIYSGGSGKLVLQFRLDSAIITGIKPIKSINRQESTISHLAADPTRLAKIASEIASLDVADKQSDDTLTITNEGSDSDETSSSDVYASQTFD